MSPEHGSASDVGCIDGSVLRIDRQGAEIRLHLGSSVARLSPEAAQRLAALLRPAGTFASSASSALTQDEQPNTSPKGADSRDRPKARPAMPPPGVSRRMGAAAHPGIADLLSAGLVDEGTIFTLRYHGIEHTATVGADGSIEFEGAKYTSPSAAARAASAGASMNGWTAWKIFDGPPIDDLRWLYRADDFPGEGHRYAPSTAGEMRQIARWWVQHALAEGLDPANPDDRSTEAFLSGHGYAESTLGSYRRHLRNWRLLYARRALPDESDVNAEPDAQLCSRTNESPK